ncbi:tetratricopeptide repeat protein 22-like [Branchiostoma lanceolatum]|uniref:tetratricopeptide repeat protein 22-like n=1 Tax=Branchiostoma lanceolatum TaxID=7740 RepID=UPI0034525748
MFTTPANMAEGGTVPTVPKPGFFHLDLFVKDTKDVSPWYDELKTRLNQETGPMENAITNLLGVFAFYKLRGQGEARKLIEGLTERDENNLNAIANKQFIYGHLMRAKDEMACRDRLQELLSEDSDAARARNARCFAEQGYALAFDVRDDSKDMVSKMKSAIDRFETALELVGNGGTVTIDRERLVWKFYLSKCYLRLDQVSGGFQHKAPTLTHDDMLKGFYETRELLIEVTKLNPSWEHSRFYLARAWALLGALESKCRQKVKGYETPENLIKEIPQTKGVQVIGPHLSCFEKAVEINPNDSEVYRRFGHMYLGEHLYEDARQMLDKSIDIMPRRTSNWVAYFIRSLVNMREYDTLAKQSRNTRGPLPSKLLIEKAKADVTTSCDGAATPFNICHLGKVCHRIAIHPVTQEVVDWGELGDALDHFALALQLEDGFTNPDFQAARGKCLEVAKEHEKAAESYKRAVENDVDNTSYIWNLYGVLKNLLTLHGNGHGEHYIAEIAFWINEGFKKYADITPVLRNCVFKFGSQMIQVCQYLIDCDNSQLAEICLKCFRRHNNSACRKRAASIQSNLLKEDAPEASGIDGPSSEHSEQGTHVKVPVTVEKPRHGQEFQYDFLVSHSSKDAGWVNYALLSALEGDMRFKGCVADRDFLPGKSVFDNIIHSIENSYKTLLILTPNFVTSEWCKDETEQALMESLKSKSGRVIPIMLHECDVPASVRTITYLDVSHDAIGSYDWLKLKKALEQIPSTKD